MGLYGTVLRVKTNVNKSKPHIVNMKFVISLNICYREHNNILARQIKVVCIKMYLY